MTRSNQQLGPLGPGKAPVKDPIQGLHGVLVGTLIMEALTVFLILLVVLKVDGGAHWTTFNWVYITVYFLMIIFFTYFYVAVTFNPEERADDMKKYGGFIPGIRPGKPTADYLSFVLSRITLPGSLYLGIIAMIPLVALVLVNANQNFPFGGTSLLIVVGVGLDTIKQIDAQLQQRHYEGLLR